MERSWVAVFHPIEEKCLSYADDRAGAINRMVSATATGTSGSGGSKAVVPSRNSYSNNTDSSSSTAGLSLAGMLQMYAKKDTTNIIHGKSISAGRSAATVAVTSAVSAAADATAAAGGPATVAVEASNPSVATTRATINVENQLTENPIISSSSSLPLAAAAKSNTTTPSSSKISMATTIMAAAISGRKRAFSQEKERGEEGEEEGEVSSDDDATVDNKDNYTEKKRS